MTTASASSPEAAARQALSAGLSARRAEIEEAARSQVAAILGTKQISDPEYTEGLLATIAAALDFGLSIVAYGEQQESVPAALLTQARLAARNGMELETVQRRYFAGYLLLDEFIHQEAARLEIAGEELTLVFQNQRSAIGRILAAVEEEHRREVASQCRSDQERLAERIDRLLLGEPVDTSGIPYNFDGQHVAAVSTGAAAPKTIRELSRTLACRPLSFARRDGAVWTWMGGRGTTRADLESVIASIWPSHIPLALGEPARGKSGFCLSHRQARSAFPIAMRLIGQPVHYDDVALEASMSQDDLLLSSLRSRYLTPLERHPDGGEKTREVIRAFLDANHSVNAAATRLGVHRHTVRNHVNAFEGLVGRSLEVCGRQVGAALRLEELGYMKDPQ